MRIYVASSWRNDVQPYYVQMLRAAGHAVYDFRNPPHGRGGFAWADIDPLWQGWTAKEYRNALATPVARDGFRSDFDGMQWADVCVLLLPCGRSAHLEAGFMAGQGKRVIVMTRDGEEPELMALLCSEICTSDVELFEALGNPSRGATAPLPESVGSAVPSPHDIGHGRKRPPPSCNN